MAYKKVEFRPPEGVVPENITAEEEFDAVCTFRLKDNGDICLVLLGEVEMPGYKDKAGDRKPRMDYGEEAQEMMERKGPSGNPSEEY